MHYDFKFGLIRRYGLQVEAAKRLDIDETRLSRIVHG